MRDAKYYEACAQQGILFPCYRLNPMARVVKAVDGWRVICDENYVRYTDLLDPTKVVYVGKTLAEAKRWAYENGPYAKFKAKREDERVQSLIAELEALGYKVTKAN